MLAVSPFVWGNSDDAAPEEIRLVKAKYAQVPVAPFVGGSADQEAPDLSEVQD